MTKPIKGPEISVNNSNFLKFLTAIVCDGILCQRSIRFNFSRKRKIEYMHKLLNDLSLHYTNRTLTPKQHMSKMSKKDITEFNINSTILLKKVTDLVPGKSLPEWFTTLEKENKQMVVDTYLFFDGTVDKRYKNDYCYLSSANLDNMIILSNLLQSLGRSHKIKDYGNIYRIGYTNKVGK